MSANNSLGIKLYESDSSVTSLPVRDDQTRILCRNWFAGPPLFAHLSLAIPALNSGCPQFLVFSLGGAAGTLKTLGCFFVIAFMTIVEGDSAGRSAPSVALVLLRGSLVAGRIRVLFTCGFRSWLVRRLLPVHLLLDPLRSMRTVARVGLRACWTSYLPRNLHPSWQRRTKRPDTISTVSMKLRWMGISIRTASR